MSAIARLLGRNLSLPFADSRLALESKATLPLAGLFYFRELLVPKGDWLDHAGVPPSILAPGGLSEGSLHKMSAPLSLPLVPTAHLPPKKYEFAKH